MTTIAVTPEPVNWSITQKVAFRFCFLLFTLYIFFNPNGVLPYSDDVFSLYIKPFETFVPWLAKHILGISKPVALGGNGSGDTTYDYVTIFLIAVLTLFGTLLWSITGRNTRNYNKLFYWFTVVIRYYVGITMIGYGFFKVIKLQFPSPTFGRLIEPIGKMSPMGLAWTYMGYSRGFNYFTGFAEISCGLLLFFRKTSTLGAVLALVVAGNIMAINYCFDVPVKLLSTTLVLMSIFLLTRDTKRLINFFFRNQEAAPSNLTPHRFKANWKNITLTAVKYLLIAYTLFFDLKGAVDAEKQYGEKAPKPPLYGLYNVEVFAKNRDTIQPLITDTTRWRRFMITFAGGAQIQMMNDTTLRYSFKPNEKKHTITASTYADTTHKFILAYNTPDPETLILKGQWKKDSVYIRLHKSDPDNFPLLKRGFHWVNEFPFNR